MMSITEETILTYEKILSGEQKAFSPYFFQPKGGWQGLRL